ncbi:MAG: glutamine-hydrolyzing carbamoyl-phosphate synthase small subunit [Opitutae bacterium]|nr:glutamine-hydrolyzing carbamoyl-phosphate synthase small subunit [Opitutae bacterium]MCD8299290.1 glutamine-hydrolyzing carbamoyl-phosphate synthase small subunit [Opitutae bacterium]
MNYNWKERRERAAYLALEDGTVFRGYSVGAAKNCVGEAVFNTGMTGYQEILTDPSYTGQFVAMTAPEIGNYGVTPGEDDESEKFCVSGFVVHELREPSNWRSKISLGDALKEQGVPALSGIDTRALTLHLRDYGSMKAFICADGSIPEAAGVEQAQAWEGLVGQDYASRVTCAKPYIWDETGERSRVFGAEEIAPIKYSVVAFDFGIKRGILRCMRRAGMLVEVVPAGTPAEEVLAKNPDGVFLSNGPADPAALPHFVANIKKFHGKVPTMGICLGHQLLGLSFGAKTERLRFGHHGCNHPVKDLTSGEIEITSQNHNYAVVAETLPADVEVTHINLNDGTVEGMRHKTLPIFSVQYHPEAAPGPHDAAPLFAKFAKLMAENPVR